MAAKKTNEVKKEIEATELKAKNAVKAAAAKTKAAAKKTAEDTRAAVKKTATVIQSPMGGEITTDEIMKKVPKDADYIYVRVDQNKIWWTRGEESGSVDIW